MAAPPQSQNQPMPPPQPYPGMYYQPMAPEHLLSHRNVWLVNAIGLGMIWIGFIFRMVNHTDFTVQSAAVFLAVTGGFLAAAASLGAALGSKKTTDMQNVALCIWAGLVVLAVAFMTAGFL